MSEQHISRGRFIAASVFILIGAALLLRNLDLLNIGYLIRTYWPCILIMIGLSHLASSRNAGHLGGWIFILIGVILQAEKLGWLDWRWYQYWPVVIIIIGLWILIRPRSKSWWPGNTIESDQFDMFTLFSGSNKTVQSSNFKGGELTTIFGGIKADLRPAKSLEKEIKLTATAIFGGIELIVPQNWRVSIHVTPILGGVEDKRKMISSTLSDDAPTLIIRGTVIFGGVEIKD